MQDIRTMKGPAKISQLHLFIINKIRSIKIELSLTQQETSDILHPFSSGNLVGGIESNLSVQKFTDENLNKLAKTLTIIAIRKNLNKRYTIHDFYPAHPLEERMVDKEVIEIPQSTELTPTKTLTILLNKPNSPFLEWVTVKEITTACNLYADKKWETKHFTAPVERAVKAKKLVRKSENEAIFKKA